MNQSLDCSLDLSPLTCEFSLVTFDLTLLTLDLSKGIVLLKYTYTAFYAFQIRLELTAIWSKIAK